MRRNKDGVNLASVKSKEDLVNLQDMIIVTKFVGSFLAAGFLFLLSYSIATVQWLSFAPLLWASALAAAGMAIGFLFGIPKVLQEGASTVEPAPAPGDEPSSERGVLLKTSRYRQKVNTNLEEISDWLTKIIVGFGLIQLKELPAQLDRLAERISLSFEGTDDYEAVGLAMILFFVVSGFLYGYLMTRLYLQGALARAENDLGESKAWRELQQQVNAALNAAAAETRRRQVRQEGAEVADDLWSQDPFAGFADGKSEQNGRRLTAEITPVHGATAVNRVHLKVYATDAKRPLTSKVVFHLHPTFDPSEIEVAPDADGVARLDILSAGVFTVGAETDGGATKLELDLKRVPGGSQEFYDS